MTVAPARTVTVRRARRPWGWVVGLIGLPFMCACLAFAAASVLGLNVWQQADSELTAVVVNSNTPTPGALAAQDPTPTPPALPTPTPQPAEPTPTVQVVIPDPTATTEPTPAPAEPTPTTSVAESSEDSTVTLDLDELSPVPAGANFFAVAFREVQQGEDGFVEEGRYRLYEPTNSRTDVPHNTAGREYCAWSFQTVIRSEPEFTEDGAKNGGLFGQWPLCIRFNVKGTGEFYMDIWPDPVGYAQGDTLGTGLAFWPEGTNGEFRVSYDVNHETWSEWVDFDTGSPGINVPRDWPLDGPAIRVHYRLDNGFVSIHYGEIRNQIVPQYGPPYRR